MHFISFTTFILSHKIYWIMSGYKMRFQPVEKVKDYCGQTWDNLPSAL